MSRQYNNWKIDAGASVQAIQKIKDDVLGHLLNGKIHSVESSKDQILMTLDKKSGIDYLIEDEIGSKGVAARVQFTTEPYNTFTIRHTRHSGAKTEYAKRAEQIKNGYFYPYYTFQAYFDNRESMNLLTIGIARTLELYEFIEKYPKMVGSNRSDNNFLFVSFYNFSMKYSMIFHADAGYNCYSAKDVLRYKKTHPHLVLCPLTQNPYSWGYKDECKRCGVVTCLNRIK